MKLRYINIPNYGDCLELKEKPNNIELYFVANVFGVWWEYNIYKDNCNNFYAIQGI